MRIDYSKRFIKQLKKAPKKIQKVTKIRLQLFVRNQQARALNNYKLKGRWQGYRSINITGDWRAVFRQPASGKRVYFIILGTHS